MRKHRKWIAWITITPLVLISALLFFIVTFDWNRAKPWLNERVSEALDRPFAINGDLVVTWTKPEGETGWRRWVPWPRLSARDVVIGNPEWARDSNLATVNRISFVLQAMPLLTNRIVIPTLSLETPSVTLQRRKDGLNNWTFEKNKDKPPFKWKLDLHEIIFSNGRVALSDALKQIELLAEVETIGTTPSTLEAPASEAETEAKTASAVPASPTDLRYGIRWTTQGTYRNARIRGSGKTGAVLRLQDTDEPFPLQADVHLGRTRIALEGTLTDPANLAALDLNLRLSGDSMAHLYDLTGVVLPETAPFETRGRLLGQRENAVSTWRYEKFTGRMGGSDIQGTLTYVNKAPRPAIHGEVVSNQLLFADLAPLIGADAKTKKAPRTETERQPSDRVLPVARFKTDRWGTMDADVKITGKRIVRDEALPINDLSTHLKLNDSTLTLDPLDFGVAGGKLVSTIRLNGKTTPMEGVIDLRARGLKLKQLFPTIESMRASVGEMNGAAHLSATGNSVAALLGSANGEAKLLVREGTVSKFILEAMGLNVGSVVLTQLFGDRQVTINCGVSDFAVNDGLAQARTFVVDTDDAIIRVTGAINFTQERLGLTVRPDSKGLRIFSLRAPIYVVGSFKKPDVSIDKGILALRAGGALALGIAAPIAAALIPLTDLSAPDDGHCADLISHANAGTSGTARKSDAAGSKTLRQPASAPPASKMPAREPSGQPLPPVYGGG